MRGSSVASASTSAAWTAACSERRSSDSSGSGPGAASSASTRISSSPWGIASSRFSATRISTERRKGSSPPRPWYSASFGTRGPTSSRSRVRCSTSARSSSSGRSLRSARGRSARSRASRAPAPRPGSPAPRRRGRGPPREPARRLDRAPDAVERGSGGTPRGRRGAPDASCAPVPAHAAREPREERLHLGIARPGARSPLDFAVCLSPGGLGALDAANALGSAADRPGERALLAYTPLHGFPLFALVQTLPARRGSVGRRTGRGRACTGGGGRGGFRTALVELLTIWGYRVFAACDGREALDAFVPDRNPC